MKNMVLPVRDFKEYKALLGLLPLLTSTSTFKVSLQDECSLSLQNVWRIPHDFSKRRVPVSITVQQHATIYSFIIFLQAALHVSGDNFTHYQKKT